MDAGTPQHSRIGSFNAQRRARSGISLHLRTQVSINDNKQRHSYWQTVLNPRPSSPCAPPTPPTPLTLPTPASAPSLASGGSGNARRHVCFLCGHEFTQGSHRNSHMRTVHEGRKPHTCEHCNRKFGKRFDLNSHVSAVHNNERPFQCRFCDKTFAKKSNALRHEQKIHKAKAN